MTEATRYDRQERIEGWDQKKLVSGTATIIGSGNLAIYTALPLAALGVGNIRIIDSAAGNEERLLDISLKGDSKAKSLEAALLKINPEIKVIGVNSSLDSSAAEYFLEKSSVIIEATNNLVSKAHAFEFASSKGIPLIGLSGGMQNGKVIVSDRAPERYPAFAMAMFAGHEQGELVALELGAVAAEEAKKFLMKQGGLMPNIYNYNLQSSQRFSFNSDLELRTGNEDFGEKDLVLVGAGALGCLLAPLIVTALRPKRLTIFEYDTVEAHNLNRQVAYHDAVGRPKIEKIAEICKLLSRGTEINAIPARFEPDTKLDSKPDLMFDAVDSFYTKAMLHNYAKRNGISLVSGGTDFRASSILVYVPGKTSCFDCQINLSQLALKTEIIRRTSCLQSPDPSVIITNQIAAAIMAGEARAVLRPEIYGNPINGKIKYLSDFETRGGITCSASACGCHKQPEKSIELPSPERVRIEEVEVDGIKVQEVYVDGRKL